jgi:hypothetical protein
MVFTDRLSDREGGGGPVVRPRATARADESWEDPVSWLWFVGAWFALAAVAAVVLGRSIHLADRREAQVQRERDLPQRLPAPPPPPGQVPGRPHPGPPSPPSPPPPVSAAGPPPAPRRPGSR